MSDRETITITTPTGKAVILRSYFTARERNELRKVFLGGISFSAENNQPKINELSGDLLDAAERKLLELAVVSYDGSAENASERILDGTPEDYDFIVQEANKIGNFKQAK